MTSNKLLSLVRELLPTEFSDSVLLMWLSNCENTILTDVMLLAETECKEIEAVSDELLLVPHPYDKLYLPYMEAQVCHANGETDKYMNFLALYNAYRDEYARHICESLDPAYRDAVKEGYYLTAYGIAKAHGYQGTEAEWLDSLRGPQGAQGIQGPQGRTGGTELPVARAISADGVSYSAKGDDLPEVAPASDSKHIGKGKQIIFIPGTVSTSEAPTLSLNGGAAVPIRLRAAENQGEDELRPEATTPVPVGSLMRGVPYTMTFCGKYWLVDSMIAGIGGDAAWVTFEIDENGDLYVITADSFRGAEFSLTEDGELEVITYE